MGIHNIAISALIHRKSGRNISVSLKVGDLEDKITLYYRPSIFNGS